MLVLSAGMIVGQHTACDVFTIYLNITLNQKCVYVCLLKRLYKTGSWQKAFDDVKALLTLASVFAAPTVSECHQYKCQCVI